MVNEFKDNEMLFDSKEFPDGEAVLKAYEIDGVNITTDMFILLGYILFLHLISFVVLHLKFLKHQRNQVNIENSS